ncbi:MAG: dehydrogenase [Planctomycetaceae bacterium]|nr:dehydrogenase [Planctomycetaceae bacterium]
MRFVCLGFFDEAKFEGLEPAKAQAIMEECLAYDAELRRGGHFAGGDALQSPRESVALELKDGQVAVTNGPYAETKEQIGGILMLEARDLNHAIALMSKHPGIQFGHWELRAVNEEMNAMIAERTAAQDSPNQS